jgi:hypothetical protein
VIAEEHLGTTHPFVAPPLYNLAEIHQLRGEYDVALPLIERASAVRRHVWGPDAGHYAGYLQKVGILQLCAKRHAKARATFAELDRIDSVLPMPIDHHDPVRPLFAAEAALAEGDAAAALAFVRRSLHLAKHCPAATRHYADWAHMADFVLARALWELPADEGRNRPHALALARRALERLRDPGLRIHEDQCSTREAELARVKAWLASRR